MTRPRSAPLVVRRLVPLALVVLLLGGLLPTAGSVRAAASYLPPSVVDTADEELPAEQGGAPADPGPVDRPSTAYEQWLEHEHDDLAFTPGPRVTVGFTPRADDTWPVGGAAPGRLPAGRASGQEMAKTRNGVAWARVPGRPVPGRARPRPTAPPVEAPIDAPANDRSLSAHAVSAAPPATDGDVHPDAAHGLRRQVYGFLPYWEVNGSASRIDYDVLSTIAYFSVGASANGNLKKRNADGTLTTGWGGWTSAGMTRVINAAHRRGTRVVLTVSVFAWTGSQASVQRSILGSRSARLNLVRQVVAAVRDRGADGVNLDFEPLARGYADEFVQLLRTFRTEFNRVRHGYSIVYDTTAFIGNYPLEASVGRGAADAIFVMGYDYRIGSSSTSGSIAPLSGPGYDLADTIRAYRSRVPASRLILGIPWYGRAWSTASDRPRSPTVSGLRNGYSTAVTYADVVAYAARYGRRWDPVEQSPYVVYRRRNCTDTYGCVTSWRQLWYDDAASMQRRYQLVNDYGLRGAGMWALGYEGGGSAPYRALAASFLVDRTAPTAGIKALDATQGDEGFLVGWAGRDASRIVAYDVQVSANGGRWKAWRTGTRATSDVFLGRQGVGYAFRVRAKDSKGHLGPWNVGATWTRDPSLRVGGFAKVTLDGLAYRAGPRTSSARLGRIRAGTIVALTRGPVRADGYTWYEATQPIRQWSPVSFVERGVWIAVGSGSRRFVRAVGAPNATIVKAGLRGMDFGAPGSATGVGTGRPQLAARAFSPNGDGSEDGLRVRWTNGVAMTSVRLLVRRTDGSLVGSRAVPDRGAGRQDWTWDGRVNGRRVRDGRYVLELVASGDGRTYHAPSRRPSTAQQVKAYAVRVDTTRPTASRSGATWQLISPNGDGFHDATRLSLAASGGAVSWTAVVADAHGGVVRRRSGSGASVTFTWAGTNDAGRRVRDGRYVVALTLFDAAGNFVRRTGQLTVDTTPPRVTPAATARAFSPNGDGLMDTTSLSFAASERASGTVRLVKGSTVVRSWRVSDASAWHATWDGRRADGTKAPDGVYTLLVRVRDGGGNLRTASTRVVVDRTLRGLRWGGDLFPQDGDTLRTTSVLSFGLAHGARTTLRIEDAAGRVVRTAWTGRALSAGARSFRWNGRNDAGRLVPQGRYLATLRVQGPSATIEYSRWVWAAAFSVTPDHTTRRPGQTLTVRFRSVEPLSTKPRVSFTQPGKAAVTVTATRLGDGSYRARFAVRSGASGTATVRVGARDADGRANATSILVRVAS